MISNHSTTIKIIVSLPFVNFLEIFERMASCTKYLQKSEYPVCFFVSYVQTVTRQYESISV